MDIGVIIIVAVLAVLLICGIIKKLNIIATLIGVLLLAAVLLVGYILLFPSSPLSQKCTTWVAANIELDPKDEHANGEDIFKFSTEDLASGASKGLDGLAQAFSGNEQMSDFFSSRLTALAESKATELADSEDKIYKLFFKDAYLQIDCSDVFVVISIVKEEFEPVPA